MTKEWQYSLGGAVTLASGEKGRVMARAEYLEGVDSYLLRYTAGDGRLTECWWNASAISPSDAQATV
jgi:hypothetical protein